MTEAVLLVLMFAGMATFGGLIALYDWVAERSDRKKHHGRA